MNIDLVMTDSDRRLEVRGDLTLWAKLQALLVDASAPVSFQSADLDEWHHAFLLAWRNFCSQSDLRFAINERVTRSARVYRNKPQCPVCKTDPCQCDGKSGACWTWPKVSCKPYLSSPETFTLNEQLLSFEAWIAEIAENGFEHLWAPRMIGKKLESELRAAAVLYLEQAKGNADDD